MAVVLSELWSVAALRSKKTEQGGNSSDAEGQRHFQSHIYSMAEKHCVVQMKLGFESLSPLSLIYKGKKEEEAENNHTLKKIRH